MLFDERSETKKHGDTLMAGNNARHLKITTDINVWGNENIMLSNKSTTVVETANKNSQDGYTAKRDIGQSPWQGLWLNFNHNRLWRTLRRTMAFSDLCP